MVAFCPKCKSKILSLDTQFCANCGAKLPKQEAVSAAKSEAPSTPAVPPKGGSSLSIAFLFLILFASGATLLAVAFLGTSPPNGPVVPGLLFWSSLAFYTLFKRQNRRPWIGALYGFLGAFALVFVAAFIAGFIQGREKKVAASPLYAAIKSYDPAAYERLRALDQEAEKDPSPNHQLTVGKAQQVIVPVLMRAIGETSDEAIVRYARARLASFEEVGRASAGDCASLVTGQGKADMAARINGYTSKASQDATTAATAFVVESAARHPPRSSLTDDKVNDTWTLLEPRLAQHGLSITYLSADAGATPDQRCQSGIELFREVLKLDEPTRSAFLRRLIAG